MKSGTDYNILVPIPEGAHRCSDNRVYVVLEKRYYQDLRYNMDSRAWIGKAVSDTEMHPNNNYKTLFFENMKSVGHINLPQYVKRTGMYAAALSIAEQTGLYEDLIRTLGPQSANLIMDYSVYSIISKSNAAKDFETLMADQMLFLGRAYTDSWIQDKFDEAITDNHIHAFKHAWLKRFNESDLSGVWLCVDGSNDDCSADIEEAEKGKAKSHKNIDIVSFLYAVTDSGIPVMSQIYRGSRVDCQAIKEMIAIFSGYGIKIKGLILDRGFCDENCIRLLIRSEYNFVIMMKENTNGFHELLEKYQDKVKLKWNYALGNGLFGTSDEIKLFKGSDLRVHASIIWDGKNGVERASYLIDEVMEVTREAESAIANGKIPQIPRKFKDYVQVISRKDGSEVAVNEKAIQSEIEAKGFYGLITSKQMSASEADAVYNLRNSSEKQYSLMKTQLGDSVFRAHNMHRIAVRELIAFTAGIIRQKLMTLCRSGKPIYDTNVAIKELNLINMNLIGHNRYQVIHNQSGRQKEIMRRIGITDENLDTIAAYETKRFNEEAVSPIQTLGTPSDTAAENTATRKIKGIPSGSSAKGKKEKRSKEEKPDTQEKRKPGRPKGSKNKPKPKQAEQTVKRGRGRPKGSKNRPKD